ncbi:MAG: hypothetical protein E5Y32_09920 [Mesorhizobium sp.]|nr:MAG: hypothetical protein E5Y32_09920 [Mesorhizobium sp.]
MVSAGRQPNYFTINGRAYPSTDTIRMKVGETLTVRFIGTNVPLVAADHAAATSSTVAYLTCAMSID